MRRLAAAAAAATLALPALPPTAHAAPAPCDLPRGYTGPVGEQWARKRLGYDRAWTLTQGEGVLTAVIDSGADTRHPMLSGRIADSVDLTGTGDRDCAGHGTGVAALIAGRDPRLGGVAPAARLLIVKQQHAERDADGGARLPKAVRAAADAGARVINISLKAAPSPALDQAVQYAHTKDAVIVAAAGNAQEQDGDQGAAYPASYPGVLSVASLGPDGARAESSGVQSKVDLAAPGKGLITPWPGGGHNPQAEGTSYAAAFVSGTAALVRSRHPHLNREQVVRRILATADGNAGTGTGRGMVNPVQAVTAVLAGETAPPPAPSQPPAAVLAAPEPSDDRTRAIATAVTAVTLTAAALAALSGVIVPMGRRRNWRPGRAALPAPEPEDTPETAPPSTTIGTP
ncbi:S8 family serine peptidase [Actinomadura rugatobispora]|uniref:S8 family serine peptidase n=1 Tax=Actinomadura rugatobispora TaxID=1994 RepID=A0ABW1ABT3_9ACTN|nr:hypothetical protein GCM10010200_030500 [Actinomadura rugatobispora]